MFANGSVDPFVGTDGDGHATPAAAVPFGLVQAGPDTGIGKWSHTSGYQYGDTTILGFSQTHLNGTGCPDLGDVSIMPFVDEYDGYGWSNFRKDSEHAEPGRYRVHLRKGEIDVDVTATERVALYTFVYGTGDVRRVCLNLPFAIEYPGSWSCKWHGSGTEVRGNDTVTGWYEREVWSRRKVAFAIRFDRPFKSVRKIVAAEGARPPKYLLDFDLPMNEPLKVKIALSRTTPEAALKNMAAEADGWDFAAYRAAAQEKWNSCLSRVQAEGDPDRLRCFYSALYRLALQPNDISDAGESPFYSTFSCWDTFRAAHPLYTILVPERVPRMVDSLLAQGRTTGYLPIWSLWGHETQCMIGTHSIPVIVDAWLKGAWPAAGDSGSTAELVFRQIKDTLTKTHEGRHKEDWPLLDRYGYYPFDRIEGESVSRTLECSYDDWCAGTMAERLGFADDAQFFFRRAANWTNVVDRMLGVARGRDSAGRWRTPFDPNAYGHGARSGNDFTEGNAWQYTWHVLQDVEGLIAALGGRERFVERLDAFFNAPDDSAATKSQRNVNGFIGRYAHGNEQGHHVAYLYALAGRPDRTAEIVREICDRYYKATPDGLCGNDDCGQMGAWYVFACLGFYPVNPCGGEYVIGAPQLEKITIRCTPTPNTCTFFTVVAKNLSRENRYVRKVTLNGRPFARRTIRHGEILAGGELVFEMTDKPVVADLLKVGSYNIRNMKSDRGTVNDWESRKTDVAGLLRKLDLDVFGLQEVLPEQLDYLRGQMPGYAFVGEFRNADRKSGEASPVCYRKDRFEAADKGTFWLSETPDIPGSKSWQTACTRVCSYLVLRDRATGRKFCFANTHTDHRSAEARERGMLLVLNRMRDFGGGAPIVFVGDHNCTRDSAPAQAVRRTLKDARDIAGLPDPGPVNSFHRWGAIRDDPSRRIDYIYVSNGIRVEDFVTHGDTRPGTDLYPSDHYPVTATIRIGETID